MTPARRCADPLSRVPLSPPSSRAPQGRGDPAPRRRSAQRLPWRAPSLDGRVGLWPPRHDADIPPPTSGVRGRQRLQPTQRGFSLLEILVAFAIAAMALGMLYRVSGNNARQAGVLARHEHAMGFAQSLLAAYQTVPAQGLNEAGQAAGFGWQVASRPYPTPVNSADPQAARLHQIVIDVSWLDGTVQRTFELTSLRPERRPPRGGVVP